MTLSTSKALRSLLENNNFRTRNGEYDGSAMISRYFEGDQEYYTVRDSFKICNLVDNGAKFRCGQRGFNFVTCAVCSLLAPLCDHTFALRDKRLGKLAVITTQPYQRDAVSHENLRGLAERVSILGIRISLSSESWWAPDVAGGTTRISFSNRNNHYGFKHLSQDDVLLSSIREDAHP